MKKKARKKKKPKKAKFAAVILPTKKTITARSVFEYIMMFYGPPGVGKTTLADDLSESTLFISTDRGTRYKQALRLEVNNWKELMDVVKKLEEEGAKDKYKVIALDHIDDICVMAEDFTCETLDIEALGDAGYAKGWRLYKKNIWSIIQRLLRLDVGLILIAHEAIKTIRTKVVETERMMPDLAKSAWKVLLPKCDLVGYCGFRRVKVKGGKSKEIRVLITQPKESLYAKDRTTRRRPEEGWEPLRGKLFAETFVEGETKYAKKAKKKKKVARRR